MTRNKLELGVLLRIEERRQQLQHIEDQMKDADFWLDHERATKLSQQRKRLEDLILEFDLAETEEELKKLELEAIFTGPYDNESCFLSVHAGSGGTEAMDWAEMLERMYLRYCEKYDYVSQVLDRVEGEEAGIKSSLILIKGFRAYGQLKSENGVHRLVRMSPFDADKARHTSFALVEVIPEIEKTTVEIKPEDIKVDVFRAGGHGGQGVNTTDSAVRITHIATGIVVTCQNERSQQQNRQQALKVLEAKLNILEEENKLKHTQSIKGDTPLASWGNQIRSYVLAPYQLVKDNRTDYETSDTKSVLDGDIQPLIEAYGRFQLLEKRRYTEKNNKGD